MELRHLTTFREVASELSFSRAAARLGYVQSAVTSHVRALETELGVRLFDRLGRRIVLTHAGSQLLDYARRIEQLTHEATTVIGAPGEPAGPVTISAPEVLCAYRLPAVIRDLHSQHPNVQLLFRANPTAALDADVQRALAHGQVDVAFVLDEDLDSTDTLLIRPLNVEPLVVIAAPEHRLTHKAHVRPGDLDGIPALLTDKGCGYRRVFERALDSAGARAVTAGEFTSSETVKRCVEASTAIGVLAAVSVAAELAAGTLVTLDWDGPELALTSYIVSRKDRWISPAQAAVHAAAYNRLGA